MLSRLKHKFVWKLNKEIGYWLLRPICYVINCFKYQHLAPSSKIIEVNINDIVGWLRQGRYDKISYGGIINDGDWSNIITPANEYLESSEKHNGIIQRFVHGYEWHETDLFKKRYSHLVKNGISLDGKKTLRDYEEYYINNIDKLYENIKENGVKPPTKYNSKIAPIYVQIYKNGEILYTPEGNHRFTICKILGIEKIPVRVWRRHSSWQKIRDHILENKGQNIDSKYESFLKHPDIASEL